MKGQGMKIFSIHNFMSGDAICKGRGGFNQTPLYPNYLMLPGLTLYCGREEKKQHFFPWERGRRKCVRACVCVYVLDQIPSAKRKQKHSRCHASCIEKKNPFLFSDGNRRKELPQSWPHSFQPMFQQQQCSYLTSDLRGNLSFVSMRWSKGWWVMIKEEWFCWPETLMRMKWEGQWSFSRGKPRASS